MSYTSNPEYSMYSYFLIYPQSTGLLLDLSS